MNTENKGKKFNWDYINWKKCQFLESKKFLQVFCIENELGNRYQHRLAIKTFPYIINICSKLGIDVNYNQIAKWKKLVIQINSGHFETYPKSKL